MVRQAHHERASARLGEDEPLEAQGGGQFAAVLLWVAEVVVEGAVCRVRPYSVMLPTPAWTSWA